MRSGDADARSDARAAGRSVTGSAPRPEVGEECMVGRQQASTCQATEMYTVPGAAALAALCGLCPSGRGKFARGDARLPVGLCLRRAGDSSPRRSPRPWRRFRSARHGANRAVPRWLRVFRHRGAGYHAGHISPDGSDRGTRPQPRNLAYSGGYRTDSCGRRCARSARRFLSILRPSHLSPVSIAQGIRVLRAPWFSRRCERAGIALPRCLWSTT